MARPPTCPTATPARLLIDRPEPRLDAADVNGVTAAQRGRRTMAQMLTRNGASVDQADGRGRTALMLAARHGKEAVAHYLVTQGKAKVDPVDASGWTALITAVQANQPDIV